MFYVYHQPTDNIGILNEMPKGAHLNGTVQVGPSRNSATAPIMYCADTLEQARIDFAKHGGRQLLEDLDYMVKRGITGWFWNWSEDEGRLVAVDETEQLLAAR